MVVVVVVVVVAVVVVVGGGGGYARTDHFDHPCLKLNGNFVQ